ncbi:hypothetical protein ABKV19_016822 [Rosa sericea]
MGSCCYILDSLKEFKAITAMLYLLVSQALALNFSSGSHFIKGPGFSVKVVFFVIPVSLQQSACEEQVKQWCG